MKTLTQGNAAWLKQGVETRVFVRVIDDAASPEQELLCIGSAAVGTFDDLIDNGGAGVASTEIRHEGGMASVSGCSVRGLYLSERLPLCTEATVIPSVIGDYRIAGRFLSASGVSFAAARAAVSAEYADSRVLAGARDNTTSGAWTVWRAPLQYPIPAALSTCEDAYIELSGAGLYGSAQLWLVAGTWDLTDFITDATEVFNDFTGWAAGASAYSIAALNESWESSEYDSTVRLRLNQAGRDAVKAAAGGYLKLMLISENDRAGTEPSGDAFVQFTGGISPTLKLRYNSVALENQIAQVYWSSVPTVSNVALMERVWTGVVDSYEIDDRNVTLTLRQNDFKKDRVIPEDVITIDAWPDCPEENVGKVIPIVYGSFTLESEHRPGVGYFSALTPYGGGSGYAQLGYPNAVKGIVVERSGGQRRVLFSKYAMKDYTFDYFLFLATGKYFELFPVTATHDYEAAHGETSILVPTAVRSGVADIFADEKFRAISTIIPIVDDTNVSDTDHAIDSDATNYTTFSGPAAYIDFTFQDSGGLDQNLGCIFIVNATFHGGFSPAYLTIEFYQDERTASEDTPYWVKKNDNSGNLWSGDGQKNNFATYLDGDGNLVCIPLDRLMARITTGGLVSGSVRLYNICGIGARGESEPLEIYTHGDGKADDVSGTVTGTPSALIENNAHAIESISRSEMSLATAEIDTAAFDAAATAITGKKAAFQLLERKKAREILSDIALHARLKLWWDEQDRLTVKKFSSTAFFPNSGTDIPAALDRFTVTGSPSGGSFTEHPILSGPRVYRVEPDEVYNDFIVSYRRNYATGDFAGVLRVNKETENVNDAYLSGTTGTALKTLCSDSYTAARGRVNTLEVAAWSIRDEATATALMQHLVERMYLRRWMVEFTAGPSALMFEPADFINVRDALLEDRFGTAAMNTKKWEIIGYALDNDSFNVKITAIEV